MTNVPVRYVPKNLTNKSRKKQIKELKRSRKNYKKGKYYTRKKVKGFKSKRTGWAKKVEDIYGLPKNKAISIAAIQRKTRCKRSALNKIIKKGMGAYYSSGSRPNQTAHSWGKARLYSAISGGPAARVDMKILKEGGEKNVILQFKPCGPANIFAPHIEIGSGTLKKPIVINSSSS